MRKNYGEFRPKRRNQEQILQEMFCRWLDHKGLLYFASLMGVNLGPRVGAIRKRMGCRAGVPDIMVLQPAGKYHGMAVELKVVGGHVTPEQEAFAKRLTDAGYYSIIMPPKFEVQDGLEWIQKEVEYYLAMEARE
jgi:hypothetical protein